MNHVDADLIERVFEELGIRSSFDTRVPGLLDRRQQADRVHAKCCGYVGRHLIDLGWEVRHEVEVGSGRSRGWIDILAFREQDGSLFCPEVKTELHDAGAVQRTLAWYERNAWTAARRLGWAPRRLASALLLLSTVRNDERASDNRALLRQAFPGAPHELAAWLTDPRQPLPARAIAVIDPRSRRREWLQSTRSGGRRSVARYRDYADAAARLGDPRGASIGPSACVASRFPRRARAC